MSITLKEISYSYRFGRNQEMNALQSINLTIRDGEFVGITGHTGCGKTTLIQLMAGLLVPSAGQILIDHEDINSKQYQRTLLREKIGVVFQYPEYQLFETTVEKDVAFGLKYRGLSSEEVNNRVRWALEIMGFSYEDIRSQSPLALSGGDKRRVAIAGVLTSKPKILILDEPIAGLDPFKRAAFLDILLKLWQDGVTIIMVSHNMDALAEYTKRILVLRNGKLVMDDTPHQVFKDTDSLKELLLEPSTPRQLTELMEIKGIHCPKNIITYEELLNYLKENIMK